MVALQETQESGVGYQYRAPGILGSNGVMAFGWSAAAEGSVSERELIEKLKQQVARIPAELKSVKPLPLAA